MTRTTRLLLCLCVVGLAQASGASAQAACVAPAHEDDALDADDLAVTHAIFEALVGASHGPLEQSPCDEMYAVVHYWLSGQLQVIVSTPDRTAYARHDRVATLPEVYERLLGESGSPSSGAPSSSDSTDVPVSAHDNRPETDVTYLVRFGGGITPSDGTGRAHPGVGLAVRVATGRFGLEISGLNLDVSSDGTTGTLVRMMPLVRTGAVERALDVRPHFGVGVGWGTATIDATENAPSYHGEGIVLATTAGVSLFESSWIRPSLELDMGFPFFDVDDPSGDARGPRGTHVALRFGIGFSR